MSESQNHDVEQTVHSLLQGAVDLHVHPGPSPFPRRIGIAEAAAQAHQAGFRAMVVKSHHHSMVTDILALQGTPSGQLPIPVFGGVALNNQVGGINPYAVELALRQGGRIVWFPTIASARHIEEHHERPNMKFPTSAVRLRPDRPISVLNESGALAPEVHEVFDLIKQEDAILAGGHLAVPELDALVRGAHETGVGRILINHPNFITGATPDLCREWAALGAYVEHSLCMYDDRSTFYHWPVTVLLEYIRAVGPERTVLSSDLGQTNNPLPVESYQRVVGMLLQEGVGPEDIRRMVGTNAAGLLGL